MLFFGTGSRLTPLLPESVILDTPAVTVSGTLSRSTEQSTSRAVGTGLMCSVTSLPVLWVSLLHCGMRCIRSGREAWREAALCPPGHQSRLVRSPPLSPFVLSALAGCVTEEFITSAGYCRLVSP